MLGSNEPAIHAARPSASSACGRLCGGGTADVWSRNGADATSMKPRRSWTRWGSPGGSGGWCEGRPSAVREARPRLHVK